MVPWALIFFCFFVIMYQTRIRFNDRQRNKMRDNQNYFAVEAGYTKSLPLEQSMIIVIGNSELPFDESSCLNESIADAEAKVKKNLESPIINTGISNNTELKRRFGAKNLEYVVDGEENYNLLIKNLNNWAELLIDEGNDEKAAQILEKAVSIGSDVSETYILLYGIYERHGNQEQINCLTERVSGLPDIAKSKVNRAIEKG